MTEEPFAEHQDQSAEDVLDEDVTEFDQPAADDDVEPAYDEPDTSAPSAPAATGHPAVDEVLRSLEALDDAPVDEHVAVFEQAHDQLRRTLSSATDDQG